MGNSAIRIADPGKSARHAFGRARKQQALEIAACSFVLLWAFGVSAAKALFFLTTAFGAGKSDHGRFRRPSPLACMDGHGPRVTFWTCDQQLIRLHCTSSAIVCCEPTEAAEGQKFSAASRRAIEIVMVMNSQPTLHDSKPMLCRGILLLLNTKKYLRAPQIAPHIPGAMQRKVHFCTQRNWETTAWFALCVLENSGIICSILTTERGMVEFSERTQANMDVVLEEVCAELPNGGGHESRKFIAEQLIQCARSGRTTLGELMYAARRAIVQLERNQRSAS